MRLLAAAGAGLCADELSLSAQSIRFPMHCAALSTLPDES